MTTEQFATNAVKCGLRPLYEERGPTHWRGLEYHSSFDRHAYFKTTADGVTWATLREDEPLSSRYGSITKPLADITDVDFVTILGMKQ